MRGIGHEHRLVSALLVTPSAGDLQSGDGLTNSEDTYRTRKCFEGFIFLQHFKFEYFYKGVKTLKIYQ